MIRVISIVLLLFFSAGTLAGSIAEQIQSQSQKIAPFQYQLDQQMSDRCVEKLNYYREKVREYPSSAYYKFLLNKWVKRCE